MRKYLLLFLLSFIIKNTFGQITFQKTIYGDYYVSWVYANDMKETPDSGYILTGSVYQDDGPNSNFLLKLDKDGDSLWMKFFFAGDGGGSVLLACDGGYLTAGPGGWPYTGCLSKTDNEGNNEWLKFYPGSQGGIAAKTNDCGYILASSTDSFGAGGYDFYIIKTDSAGNTMWTRTYGGAHDDMATSAEQTADGGYIIAGYTNSFDTSGYEAYLIKTDMNGDTLWTKTYGPPIESIYTSAPYSVLQTYDHGYIMLGNHLIKIDSAGNVMWSSGDFRSNNTSIQQTTDSGYVFVGQLYIPNNAEEDVLLVKISNAGNFLWARDFPGSRENPRTGTLVFQTSDGGFMEVDDYAEEDNEAAQNSVLDFSKTDANGHSGCGQYDITVALDTFTVTVSGTPTFVTSPIIAASDSSILIDTLGISFYAYCFSDGVLEKHLENSITIYPNPTTNQLTIHTSNKDAHRTVTIYNTLGMLCSQSEIRNMQFEIQINVSQLASGIYFVEVIGEKEQWVGKFVKQ